MHDGRIVQNCQHEGYRNAVVTAQGGPVGSQPLSVPHKGDGLAVHVQFYARVLFAYHIHMALEDKGRRLFKAGGRIRIDDNVAGLVLHIPVSVIFCKGNEIIADGLRMEGSVGNGGNFSEKAEYFGRLQRGYVVRVSFHFMDFFRAHHGPCRLSLRRCFRNGNFFFLLFFRRCLCRRLFCCCRLCLDNRLFLHRGTFFCADSFFPFFDSHLFSRGGIFFICRFFKSRFFYGSFFCLCRFFSGRFFCLHSFFCHYFFCISSFFRTGFNDREAFLVVIHFDLFENLA